MWSWRPESTQFLVSSWCWDAPSTWTLGSTDIVIRGVINWWFLAGNFSELILCSKWSLWCIFHGVNFVVHARASFTRKFDFFLQKLFSFYFKWHFFLMLSLLVYNVENCKSKDYLIETNSKHTQHPCLLTSLPFNMIIVLQKFSCRGFEVSFEAHNAPVLFYIHPVASVSSEIINKCQCVSSTGSLTVGQKSI